MQEKKYKQLKREYRQAKLKPSGKFLCKIPPSGEVIFGIKATKSIYGIYNKEQNGYELAVERTPVPEDPLCSTCGQTLV